MPPVDRTTFHQLVRELDDEAFATFVARLWTERGWSVRSDDGELVATRTDPPDRLRIRPTTGRRPPIDASQTGDPPDIIVTTDRYAGSKSDRPDPRVVDIRDLYELALYGIDRTALDVILRDCFDRSLESLAGERGSVRGRLGRVAAQASSGRRVRVIGVTLLAVALVLAGASALAFDSGNTAADSTTGQFTTPTAVPTATAESTPTPVPMEEGVVRVPGCPSPPIDAHPRDLRPPVIEHVSPTGLEGWTITAEATIESFPGPNALPTPIVPEVQHVATYRNPTKTVFRLVISRWESHEDSVRVVETVNADGQTWLVWGPYTASVRVYEPNGTIHPESTTLANTRLLFSEIQDPDGGKLGGECVRALLESGSNPGSTTHSTSHDDPTGRTIDPPTGG